MPTQPVPLFPGDPAAQQQAQLIQNRMDYARALQMQSLSPMPQGSMAGNIFVRPSWTQQLADALSGPLSAYMERSAAQDLGTLQTGYYNRIHGMMGGRSAPDTAAAANDQDSPQYRAAVAAALSDGADNGSVGPTNSNAQRLASALQQYGAQPAQTDLQQPRSSGSQASMNPQGWDPEFATRFFMLAPDKFMETQAAQLAPTDLQKTAMAAGLRPGTPEYQQFMLANLAKQNYIAPIAIRPGGAALDPRNGSITTTPSAAPTGFQSVRNRDGTWSYVPVQNGSQAIAYSSYAGEFGKAPFQTVEGFDSASGAPYTNYRGNLLTPPKLPPLPSFGDQSSNDQPHGGLQVKTGPNRQAPTVQSDRADVNRNQGYTDETLRILQGELAKTTDPNDAAAINREISRVQDSMHRAPGIQTGPRLGEAQGATNAQNELSDAWRKQLTANETAQTNVSLLQQMKGLADQAVTGFEPTRRTYLAKLGAFLGVPGMDEKASSTDLLAKYSSQLIQALSSRGMNTDAARDLVLAGTPNSHMQASAVRDAVDGLLARERMTQARTQVLQPYASSRDASGFQAAAARFDQAADPRLWQMLGMDPQQLSGFVAKMSPGDAHSLMVKYTAAKQAGYLQ